jgi:hypothetical protein
MISMRRAAFRAAKGPLGLLVLAVAAACVVQRPVAKSVTPADLPVKVGSAVKAHLVDGSTIIYRNGVSLSSNTLLGFGSRFALGATGATNVSRMSLDSVVGMEAFTNDVSVPGSVALTLVGIAGSILLGTVAAVALFGSCPTFYADSAGIELLQGEGFSYAIAPLFEQRDVDRLRLTPTADGRVILNIRNEALETHYINHLELLEVQHALNEHAVPDHTGHALALGTGRIPAAIRDRSGRDVSAAVAAPDSKVFTTLDARLAAVTTNDLDDHIDVEFSAPQGADSIAVVLDMRNSLLNTVLLYDHILAAPGIKSLDFLGKDLGRIAGAVDMGRWYAANMGMRVTVLDGDQYRPIARIGDSGPIAFHRMAVLVPAVRARDGNVHVRLSFVADDWRIDEISVADKWRRPAVRTISLSKSVTADATQDLAAAQALREPDEDYVITIPGQSFRAEFNVGTNTRTSRTWFAVSQGYYTEWVRGDWIKNASGKPFIPSNEALVDAIRGWRSKQTVMETQFYNNKISAR